MICRQFVHCVLTSAAAIVVLARVGFAQATEPTSHLEWANLLVETLDPANNVYGSSPVYVYWAGYEGHALSENRSKCSSFATELLERAYDVDFVAWMGCSSPIADRYYETIAAQNGFVVISSLTSIQPGDFLAIKNGDAGCYNVTCGSFQGCSSSGHVALAAAIPTRRSNTSPLVAGTTQYALTIVDSSASYHGTTDTRYHAEVDGSDDNGVGRGVMRLYADSNGNIAGHTWSTFSNSVYYAQVTRPLIVGRLVQ